MIKIGEGAEATIYLETAYGREIVIKSRKPKGYRIKELDGRIRRQRTRKEAKLMKRAADSGISVPRVMAVGQTVILMEKIEGKLLNDTKITKSQARAIGEILAKLHNSGIAHGDFTPANIMYGRKKIYLMDFGLSEYTESNEEKALDILLMKRRLPGSTYPAFIKSYSTAKSSKQILVRLAEIEERGRYQSRSLG